MIYKFTNYSSGLKKIINEKETFKILEETFYQGFPKKERGKIFKTPETLSNYAFKNYTTYYLTFYKNNKPFVNVSSGDGTFDLLFLDSNEKNEVFVYLIMRYFRVDPSKRFNDDIYEPLPNKKIFLYEIIIFNDDKIETTRKEIKFLLKDEDNDNDKLVVTERKCLKKDNSRKNTVEETTEVNLLNNFFKAPKNFHDYKHLFDFENLLKPEYFKIKK